MNLRAQLGMRSNDLTRERIAANNFPADDPLWIASKEAFDAVASLGLRVQCLKIADSSQSARTCSARSRESIESGTASGMHREVDGRRQKSYLGYSIWKSRCSFTKF